LNFEKLVFVLIDTITEVFKSEKTAQKNLK